MKYAGRLILGAGLLAVLAGPARAGADVTNAAPDFHEVYNLIREHLAGANAADLDQAAVQGLLRQLHSKVSLVAAGSDTNSNAQAPLVDGTKMYDGGIGYLRVQRVGDGLADKLAAAFRDLAGGTNVIEGVVIDLRYARGRDYAAAAAAADDFLTKERPLLDWGNGVVRSTAKSDAILVPLVVLVNEETAGAAEALAAVLRETAGALVIGSTTAGEATIDQEFSLSTGQKLKIATATVKLGNGETLSANGLVPDIPVTVSADDEKAYYDDPYKEIAKPLTLVADLGGGGTNSAGTNHPRILINEADLMRERKARPGLDMDYAPLYSDTSPTADTKVPVVLDPVLGRALDLIKGISVLRSPRPS
jgi:hypothetical protein